jgi:hypothetical protein
MFESLRAAIHAALDAATPPEDSRHLVSQMREAVIDARASLELMREGVQKSESRLAFERSKLEESSRRQRLADGIDDQETVDVAMRFVKKHQDRVTVLEEKLGAQQNELALAEREYAEMKAEFKNAEKNRVAGDAARHVESAWRNVEAAGGTRPETDLDGSLLKSRLDREARESAAEDQLAELKRRMGKD